MFGWLLGSRKELFVIEEMENGQFRARFLGFWGKMTGKCLDVHYRSGTSNWLVNTGNSFDYRTATERHVISCVKTYYLERDEKKAYRKNRKKKGSFRRM